MGAALPAAVRSVILSLADDVRVAGSRALALVEGGTPPTEYLMFAPGVNATVKGDLLFDDEAAAAVLAFYESRGRKRLAGDWEHDSMVPPSERAPGYKGSPASHWFDLEVRPGPELWAVNVKWTPDAFAQISKGEYLHTSPVVQFEKATGRIVAVISSALTNDPATVGQPQLFAATAKPTKALTAPTEKNPMAYKMSDDMAMKLKSLADAEHESPGHCAKALRSCLAEGMPEHFKPDLDPAANATMADPAKEREQAATLEKIAGEERKEADEMKASLSALTGKATPGEIVAVVTAWKHGAEEVVALTAAAAKSKDQEIAAVLDKGKKAMKLTPADLAANSRTKAGQYIATLTAKGDVAGIAAYVDALPARAVAADAAAKESPQATDLDTVTLTAAELAACEKTGKKPADMLAVKREHYAYLRANGVSRA